MVWAVDGSLFVDFNLLSNFKFQQRIKIECDEALNRTRYLDKLIEDDLLKRDYVINC